MAHDKDVVTPRYFAMLHEHGMLRDHDDQRTLRYALNAATTGFFLLERAPFTDEGLALETKAEHGRLDGTQTNYCRNSKIALMEGVLASAHCIARAPGANTPLRDRPARARRHHPTIVSGKK